MYVFSIDKKSAIEQQENNDIWAIRCEHST